jgi:hypothetical protein
LATLTLAGTLRQWTNSSGHRANLLLPGAKWIGVAKTYQYFQHVACLADAGADPVPTLLPTRRMQMLR